ncbi:MAG: hypothetical protein IJE84_03175 [Clostridia bacterium]|nr:hypothetical protein [Clostridia bacterium]
MNVAQVKQLLGLESVTLPDPEREIEGGYTGDLLSWVMGRVGEGNAWITIMSNINIVAVASLADVACIILAEGVTLEEDVITTATQKQINILSSELGAYELCSRLSEALR